MALHIDEEVGGARKPGAASRWWLHHSLTALAEDLRQYGVPLVLAAGDPRVVVPEVVQEAGASHVVWNRLYHRPHRDVDAALMSRLREDGVVVEAFAAFLLHERFGELSPHEVWHRSVEFASEAMSSGDAEAFRGELLWREFAWHRRAVLPQLDSENIRPEFDDFAWDDDPQALRAWQQGRTGVPLVDAGMRELWETGYMHNRVRMVTASFLVKNLLQDWRKGEQWFWDTLVDADEGANPFNWQWVAGSGDDAAPYFRIFNPHRQAERFDPLGVYVDRWVPREEQEREPIVDVAQSRREALAEYRRVKN